MTRIVRDRVLALLRAMHFPTARVWFAALSVLGTPALSAQDARVPERSPFELFGDVRLRFESDFDSQRSNGVPRADRDRLRNRTRLGVRWHASDELTATVRARTGRADSQQSPHLTFHDFDDGPTDHFHAVLDEYFLRFADAPFDLWAGRNELPLAAANDSELLWDKDATVLGGGGSFNATSVVNLQAAVFGLPDGAEHIRGVGSLLQARGTIHPATDTAVELSSALLSLRGADRTTHLLDGNGQRDYAIGILGARLVQTLGTEPTPLRARFGVDLVRNFAHYAVTDPDPISAAYRDDRNGWVLSASLGQRASGKAGEWELRWAYAWIEKLAVDASFAQDDWVRWGSGGQTDSSDLRGHELGARYFFADRLSVFARYYDVASIRTAQDGMRFRLDFEWSF